MRCVTCVALLVTAFSSAVPAFGNYTVLNDTDPSTSDWFYVGNDEINVSASAPIALTGGTELHLTAGQYANPAGGAAVNMFDSLVLMRALPTAVNLGVGDWIQLEFSVTAPTSPFYGGGNIARDIRAMGFRFVGQGGTLDFPTGNTLWDGTLTASGDYPFTAGTVAENRSAYNIGADVTLGNAQANNGQINGPSATGGNANNAKLFLAANGPSLSPSVNFPSAFSGEKITFYLERLADDGNGFVVYTFTTTVTQADATTMSISNTTFNASAANNIDGTLWTHIAFGVGAGSQIGGGQTKSMDVTYDNIKVTTSVNIPEPSAAMLIGLAGLIVVRRRARGGR